MSRRPALLLLGAIALAGLYLRAAPIAERPFWIDEAISHMYASNGTYAELLTWRGSDLKQPPMNELVLKLVEDTTGRRDEWVLRLPSVACGTLCILVVYWLGAHLAGRTVGLWAALLCAVDPNLVNLSQQARMFSLMMLPVLGALALALASIERPRRFGAWGGVAVGVLLALGTYANQLALAAWAAVGAATILVARGTTVARIALGVATLLSAPGLLRLAATVHEHWLLGLPSTGGFELGFGGAVGLVFDAAVVGELAIGALLVAGALHLWRVHRAGAALLGCLAVASAVMFVPLRLAHEFFAVRFLVIAEPAVWLALAATAALPAPRWRRVSIGALAVIAAWQAYRSTDTLEHMSMRDRYREAWLTFDVVHRREPGDALVYGPEWSSMLGTYYGVETDGARDRARRTWVILNDTAMDRRSDREAASRTLESLALQYGVELEAGLLDGDDARWVRIDSEGAEVRTLPEILAAPPPRLRP